jgi:hypothetical protein
MVAIPFNGHPGHCHPVDQWSRSCFGYLVFHPAPFNSVSIFYSGGLAYIVIISMCQDLSHNNILTSY